MPGMQTITLRVVTGSDRGRVYAELRPPITIGREEGNAVQVNDERVSRFHVKIQEDDGRLVVTDLDSTNGTRVNGHPCNLKILRYGDTISIGRTVLIVGTREQVAEWFNDEPTRSIPQRGFNAIDEGGRYRTKHRYGSHSQRQQSYRSLLAQRHVAPVKLPSCANCSIICMKACE